MTNKTTKEKVNEEIINNDPVSVEPEKAAVPSLDLSDLSTVLQLIDIGIQRGTYKPNELVAVGTVHNTLKVFLEYQVKLQQIAAAVKEEKTNT